MGFTNLADLIKLHVLHQWMNLFSGRCTRAELLDKSADLRNAYYWEALSWFEKREKANNAWLYYPMRNFN